MNVKTFMTQPVITVREDTTLEAIARTLLEHHIGGVPVVDAQGKIIGIVTESDFAAKEKGIPFSTFRAPQIFGQWLTPEGMEQLYATARNLTAQDVMRKHVVTLTENQSMADAVELMLRYDINRVPVVRDGVPVGIVARHDLLRMVIAEKRSSENDA